MSVNNEPVKKPTQEDLVKEIEEFIKRNPNGVSIQDVSREFKITRYNGAQRIGVQQIGPVKVHYYKGGE